MTCARARPTSMSFEVVPAFVPGMEDKCDQKVLNASVRRTKARLSGVVKRGDRIRSGYRSSPDHAVCLPDGQSTITEAYASGVNILLALKFFELQARVRWICLEHIVSALGLALGIRRQIMKQTPEIPGGPGLHQSRSLSGSVSHLASSSRASRAIRRMTSRFSAKRAFQASSSASEARICEAIASCSSSGRLLTRSRAFSSSLDTITA